MSSTVPLIAHESTVSLRFRLKSRVYENVTGGSIEIGRLTNVDRIDCRLQLMQFICFFALFYFFNTSSRDVVSGSYNYLSSLFY